MSAFKSQRVRMCRRIVGLALFCTALSSCSYWYDVRAVARGDRLVFIVDPKSQKEPSCLRQVEVVAKGGKKAEAKPGDDFDRVGYGTFWFESIDQKDDCANRFPLTYGEPLIGQRQSNLGSVAPKPLLRGVVYEVSTTTGVIGYGGGQFIIHTNGRVENFPAGTTR